jgi:polyether ionophore transport system ATP-binding protein
VLRHLVELDVRTLTSSPPTLEELFLRHYGGGVDADADAERIGSR